jgi:hypothetical protein
MRFGVEDGEGRVAPSPDFNACASIGGVSPLPELGAKGQLTENVSQILQSTTMQNKSR